MIEQRDDTSAFSPPSSSVEPVLYMAREPAAGMSWPLATEMPRALPPKPGDDDSGGMEWAADD